MGSTHSFTVLIFSNKNAQDFEHVPMKTRFMNIDGFSILFPVDSIFDGLTCVRNEIAVWSLIKTKIQKLWK